MILKIPLSLLQFSYYSFNFWNDLAVIQISVSQETTKIFDRHNCPSNQKRQ